MFYLLPIGNTGVVPILKGMWAGLPSFLGFEMLLLIFPYVQATNRTKLKVTTYANICTTCFYTFLTLACTLFFSPKEILLIPQPVLYLIKSFELSIIERPDIVFTSSWIMIVSSTIMAFLYAASKGAAHVLRSYHRTTCTYWGACFVFFITSVCNETSLLPLLSNIVSTSGLLCAGVIPTGLLLLSFLLKKNDQQGDCV
ncbi:hypothetical protein CN488_29630 [Bacillus anthracis]|nr:hypothetical protein CN488_29630 [Bacillus anthracis]